MSPETITLEEAVRLLELPRVIGVDSADGEEVVAMNGRYGPFIRKGDETRSLESEDQLFSITLEQALDVLAQPKTRRARGAAKPPLRDLGADPASGRPILVKEGRFGRYVTDGETNASLRGGETVDSLTLDRAVELLTERRARGPAARPQRRRARS
jgi:DNA topoisomerase-1